MSNFQYNDKRNEVWFTMPVFILRLKEWLAIGKKQDTVVFSDRRNLSRPNGSGSSELPSPQSPKK